MLIDDHEIVLEGIERVLTLDGRVEVVSKACSLTEAMVFLEDVSPDVVVLDLRLPDSDGYGAIQRVKEKAPNAKVVAITGYGKAAKAPAMRFGADAFLTKELASDVITQTICDLFPGGPTAEAVAHDALSPRELDVARLVATGLSNAEVARALCVSRNTVKTHLGNVMRKLGIRDRVALALHWQHRRQ
jgi:two-component system NarL family response regulator